MTGSTPALVARTRRLDAEVDHVAVARADGVLWDATDVSLAGRGVAREVVVDRGDPARCAAAVTAALGAVDVDDAVGVIGCGPVALGAWAFDPGRSGTLVVPEVVVGRNAEGTRWVTTTLPADRTTADHDACVAATLADAAAATEVTLAGFPTAEPPGPSGFRLDAHPDPAEWCEAVAAACADLRAGAADKVVLAREVEVIADDDFPVAAILTRLRRSFPDALRFSVGGLVGASPELLVARAGDIVRCHPLAGTAPRSGDPATDGRLAAALLSSSKNLAEHRHTIDAVHDALIGYCSYLDEEAEPSVVAVANVQHLGTRVQGRLADPPASVVELVCALHPTPAVCGRPREAALALIARHESLERGRWAGPVGWVDAAGNGAWAVGIRSAEIDGRRARVFAGVGVLPDSDPAAELAETRAKLAAMLGAIVRP